MSKESTDPKAAVRKTTKATLGKYKAEQLLAKLEKGTLIGISKEVAIEILEYRKVDVSKYKDKPSAVAPAKTEKAPKAKTEKVEKEKPAKKEKAEGEEGVKRTRTTLTQDQLSEILKRSKDGESCYKIRVEMNLPYSAVRKIVDENK